MKHKLTFVETLFVLVSIEQQTKEQKERLLKVSDQNILL